MAWSDHPSWAGSTRAGRLPADWPARRAAVLARDGHRCVTCGAPANQVDHIVAGDDHRLDALQSLCRTCHASKSAREGSAAGNARRWARDNVRRPPEPHPGLRA